MKEEPEKTVGTRSVEYENRVLSSIRDFPDEVDADLKDDIAIHYAQGFIDGTSVAEAQTRKEIWDEIVFLHYTFLKMDLLKQIILGEGK